MSLSQNSVIARSRAVYGRSLTADEISRLCAMTSVSQAAAFLKNTSLVPSAVAEMVIGVVLNTKKLKS